MDPRNPVCIAAVSRSGTQSLRSLLNRHPALHIAAYSEIPGRLFSATPDLSVFVSDILREESETGRGLSSFLEVMQRFICDFWTSTRAMEEEPALVHRWGFLEYDDADALTALRQIFTGICFIHIVRDGRDVVASWLGSWNSVLAVPGVPPPTTTEGGVLRPIRREPADVARHWAHCVDGLSDRADLTVRLEDLSNPAIRPTVVASLLDLIGLPFAPEMETAIASLPWCNAETRRPHRHRIDLGADALSEIMGVEGFVTTLQRFGYMDSPQPREQRP